MAPTISPPPVWPNDPVKRQQAMAAYRNSLVAHRDSMKARGGSGVLVVVMLFIALMMIGWAIGAVDVAVTFR